MPPEALTFTAALTESLIRRTSSTVAPPVEKPVEVFTNFAPAASAMRQAVIFSSRVSRHVSMMTFTAASGTASTTARISSSTAFASPSLSSPTFMTISVSDAPPAAAVRASKDFASELIAPSGKPTTQQTATVLPSSSEAASGTRDEFTHTDAKPYSRASAQSFLISSAVAAGFRLVWSMYRARFILQPPFLQARLSASSAPRRKSRAPRRSSSSGACV